jgi:hypothetical protein
MVAETVSERREGKAMSTLTIPLGTVRVPTEAAAEALGIDGQTLRHLVAKGVVEPAVRGRVRKGRPHRFSPAQLTGLAVGIGLWRSPRRASLEYMKALVELFERMGDRALGIWLGLAGDWDDPHAEETMPGWSAREPFTRDKGNPRLASDDATKADIVRRLERVKALLRAELAKSAADAAPGRLSSGAAARRQARRPAAE